MNNFHIIMAFNRPHMVDIYTEFFWPHNIVLHPIMRDNIVDWPNENWIKPITAPAVAEGTVDLLYTKCNYFIETQPINDEDYYMFLCDDDSIEDNVIPAIKEMNDDVIFISMKRGYHIDYSRDPLSWHGTNTLYARPECVKVCNIGLEQFIVKGKILKEIRFRDHNWADGYMCEYLKEHYSVSYREDLFSLFNFYETVRWTE